MCDIIVGVIEKYFYSPLCRFRPTISDRLVDIRMLIQAMLMMIV